MKTGNFIIGSLDAQNKFSATSDPKSHTTRSSAVHEAERLAKLHPQKSFVVLEISGIVQASQVVWR